MGAGEGLDGGERVREMRRARHVSHRRPTRREPFLSPAHIIYANHAPGHSVGPRPQAAAAAAKHAAVILPLPRVTRALRAHPRPGIIFPIP